MKFFKEFSPFQKGFFVFFMAASIITFFLPAFIKGGTLDSVLTFGGIIGLIATLTGVITSIYQARGNLILYTWWIVNTIAMLGIDFSGNLYGQGIKTIILTLPLQVYGLLAWKKNLEKSKTKVVTVRRVKGKEWIIYAIVLVVGWYLYMLLIKYLPYFVHYIFGTQIKPDPSLILDSISGTLTTFAFYLTARRYVEQWAFWILANMGFILFVKSFIAAPHFSIVYLSGAVMWGQYLVSSIYGYFNWIKIEKQQKAEALA